MVESTAGDGLVVAAQGAVQDRSSHPLVAGPLVVERVATCCCDVVDLWAAGRAADCPQGLQLLLQEPLGGLHIEAVCRQH